MDAFSGLFHQTLHFRFRHGAQGGMPQHGRSQFPKLDGCDVFGTVALKGVVGLNQRLKQSMRLAFSRSEENTSELQSLMRISYAVFGLKKKNNISPQKSNHHI